MRVGFPARVHQLASKPFPVPQKSKWPLELVGPAGFTLFVRVIDKNQGTG